MINFQIIRDSLPQLFHGAAVTLALSFGAAFLGFAGGTALGVLQTSSSRLARGLVTAYVTVIRGTPMLIQIVFFYILTLQLGIPLSKFTIALIAIGMNSSAYISQVIRSGIQSISKGQIEAAKTLGISQAHITRFIVLPQALRTVLPALGNECVTLIKDSSLASIIGVTELYMEGQLIRNQAFDALSAYTAVAVMYLLITSVVSFVFNRFEKYMRHAQY